MNEQEAKFGELARKFGETEEEFNPETNEEHEKLRQIARNIIDCFDWDPNKEDFLVVTDTKVLQENPFMVRAVEHELKAQKEKMRGKRPETGGYRILTTEASPKSATPLMETIGEAMCDKPVLILTSMSRSHSTETGQAIRSDVRTKREDLEELMSSEKMRDLAGKGFSEITPEMLDAWSGHLPDEMWENLKKQAKDRRSRLISITKGHNPYEILTKGAVFEGVEKLRDRADKIRELMKDVKRVHVTTDLGTDLWLTIRPDLAEVEDGRVDKPGKVSNYPIGEWACSPDWEGSDGILVVDGPCGGNINQDILDKYGPLRLKIKNGEIVGAEGKDELLKIWRGYLDSGNNDRNHAYKLAELGIGTNSKALEEKPREYWGSTEGEKKRGTSHIAVGSNGSLGRTPDDPFFNAAKIHCDMVLGLNQGGEVTVECEKKDGSTFKLIEKGQPVGY